MFLQFPPSFYLKVCLAMLQSLRCETQLNSLNQLIGTPLMKKRKQLLISSSLIDMGEKRKDGEFNQVLRCVGYLDFL